MSIVFDHLTHFSYLKERLDPRKSPRGIKSKFAAYLRVQPAFISQVLNCKSALSLEQADLANQFFEHSSEEAEFFLLLTSHDRAGTNSLKSIFVSQIQKILQNRQLLVQRIGKKAEITKEAKGVYYSSWIYPTVHIGCTIPALATRSRLAEYLNISPDLVGKALDFLEQNLLVEKINNQYQTTNNWVRLGKDSDHIIKHHTNWRHLAIQNLDIQTDEDLHYSGVFSMDANSFHQIKSAFLDFIKMQMKTVESAKEVDLFVMGIDFFQPFKK